MSPRRPTPTPLAPTDGVRSYIPTFCRRSGATAFVLPAAGTYGTVARDSLIGPGLFTLDAALVKAFRPIGGQSLTFRLEAFNLTNRANFGLPNPVAFQADGSYSGTAGVITTLTTPARQIQLGLRYSF